MTRPDGIPEWAWVKGVAFANATAVDAADSEGRRISRVLVHRIAKQHARALMAERKACALRGYVVCMEAHHRSLANEVETSIRNLEDCS